MKYVLLIVGVIACFVLGYLLEPSLRNLQTGKGDQSESMDQATPESPPQTDPTPAVNPEAAPEIEPAPEPQPLKDDEAAHTATTDNEIRQIMSHSIQTAEIDHFTIGQITQWKNFSEEQIDGVNYQFGLIDYREQTIFGEREVEAKALIRDGKVEKWIWTSNGMRIP